MSFPARMLGSVFPIYRDFRAGTVQVEWLDRARSGGEGGIRTPDTLLGCNCLAGSPVRPLQHLSAAKRVEGNAACPASIAETAGGRISPKSPC